MIVEDGKYYLYRHIRLDKNEVFYIGIGTKSSKCQSSYYKRANDKSRRRNVIWNRIISHTKFIVEIILETNCYEFAKQKEIEFIKLYGRLDSHTGTLANLTDGGEGTSNVVYSKERAMKISKANRGRKKSLEEIKQITDRAKKPVINKKTLQIFESIELAARNEGMAMPKFRYRMAEAKTIDFDYEYLNPVLNTKVLQESKIGKAGVKVINTETGIIYDTVSEAALHEGIDLSKFYRMLNYKKRYFKFKRIQNDERNKS